MKEINPLVLYFLFFLALYNKAKIIKDEILGEVEGKIKKIEEESIERSQAILKSIEPTFLPREDRLKKIKGMILSSINKAINEDSDGIKELKKLIHRLEIILFE